MDKLIEEASNAEEITAMKNGKKVTDDGIVLDLNTEDDGVSISGKLPDSYDKADLAFILSQGAEALEGLHYETKDHYYKEMVTGVYPTLQSFFMSKFEVTNDNYKKALLENIERLQGLIADKDKRIEKLQESLFELEFELEPYRSEVWIKVNESNEIETQLEQALDANEKLYTDLKRKDAQVDRLIKVVEGLIRVNDL
jgi:hypothetical protein